MATILQSGRNLSTFEGKGKNERMPKLSKCWGDEAAREFLTSKVEWRLYNNSWARKYGKSMLFIPDILTESHTLFGCSDIIFRSTFTSHGFI